MTKNHLNPGDILRKQRLSEWIAFICVTLLGLLVFVVFSHMRPILLGAWDWIGRLILMSCLLVFGVMARRSAHFNGYAKIFFAFFVSAFAMAVDKYLPSSHWLLDALQIPVQTPAGIAIDKLDSSLIIVISILCLSKVFGRECSSLYLCKGNIRRSLKIGVIAFVISASAAYFVALLFGAAPYAFSEFLNWSPFIFIFIASNAFNEELLFRGQFLSANEQAMPKLMANLAIAIPFVLHHTGIEYTKDVLMFLVFLFPLALAWGHISQSTKSIWGSFLFHAGMDIPVVIALFSNMNP